MSLRNSLIYSVRWHRRIGLLCTLFVFLLSITGLLLNHTSSLKLNNIKIHSSILASLYGLPTPMATSLQVEEHWISHDGLQQLYLQDAPIEQCSAPLLGAALHNGLLHVLCRDELLLLSPDGELLETITPMLGLPANTEALALLDGQLLIKTASAIINADLDTLQWHPTTATIEHWPKPQSPPSQLRQQVSAQAPAMDLEQILLDLHSGRLFGGLGVLVMDVMAILLIVLSITGFVAWYSSRRLRKGNKRKPPALAQAKRVSKREL